MIFLEIYGGIGNQMFQYAFYKKIKMMEKNVTCVKNGNVSEFPFCLDIFPNISLEECNNKEYEKLRQEYVNRSVLTKVYNKLFRIKSKVYYENTKKDFDNNLLKIDNCIIRGYFQGKKYIEGLEGMLKHEFIFPQGEEKLDSLIMQLGKNSCSIHIRRGDYLKYQNKYGGICDESYYRRAIEYMNQYHINMYVFFSNDIKWVKSNFKMENALYIDESMFENYKDWYDMFIMSRCTHNIIANSTFSWWGAWLNNNPEKVVISPPYFKNNEKNDKLLMDTWISL